MNIDCSNAINFLKERNRMCHTIKCCECSLSHGNNEMGMRCGKFVTHYPKRAVRVVQKWSDENPLRTYLSELLKAFPNTRLNEDGTPTGICPSMLNSMLDRTKIQCKEGGCIKCWNEPIEGGKQ